MSKIEISELIIKDKEKELVNINFDINSSTSLIGQSGSGKSLTLKAILNLVPNNLDVNINIKSKFELTKQNIALIPQNPFTSLSPMTKIAKQFFCADDLKIEVLKKVGLEQWVLNRFPSQLSGGQLQRVVIAIALSQKPKLLLLDEPTTALDSKNKKVILSLLETLQNELELKMLFVTHDIFSIENICDDIVILKNGKIVEFGKTKDILNNPAHQYTKELINSDFKNKKFRE